MARPIRGHPVPQSQQEGKDEPEKKLLFLSNGDKQTPPMAKIADYNPDVDFKPEGSDPDTKEVN